MSAGLLDRRITLLRSADTRDDLGGLVEAWEPVARVWAQVQPVRGTEAFASQQRFAEVDTRFRIRYRLAVTPLSLVEYDGRRYDVVEVLEVGRREWLDVMGRARAE